MSMTVLSVKPIKVLAMNQCNAVASLTFLSSVSTDLLKRVKKGGASTPKHASTHLS